MIVCEFCGDEDNGEFIHENGFYWCQICYKLKKENRLKDRFKEF